MGGILVGWKGRGAMASISRYLDISVSLDMAGIGNGVSIYRFLGTWIRRPYMIAPHPRVMSPRVCF